MHRTSELLIRNRDALPAGAVLLFNPPRDGLIPALGRQRRVSAFCQDFGDFEWLQACGADTAFGLTPPPSSDPAGEADTVILFLPREKDRLDMLVHALADRLAGRPGELWLVGENREGIKSAGKRLAQRFGAVEKVDAARHSVLFRAAGPLVTEPFRPEDYGRKWELEMPAGLPGGTVRIVSVPGVFAHGRLDAGTALLLSYVGDAWARLNVCGAVLDFGCGAGIIGLALARARPELRLTFLDSSAAALTSAAWSAAANGLPADAVRIQAADGLRPEGETYDWIFSNPPFHRGVDTDYEVVRRFFAGAASRLSKKGTLVLVCNRHLPYESWLEEPFAHVEQPVANREFKLLCASAPRIPGRA